MLRNQVTLTRSTSRTSFNPGTLELAHSGWEHNVWIVDREAQAKLTARLEGAGFKVRELRELTNISELEQLVLDFYL